MKEIIHKETNITIVHKIDVDSCIADEILKLNNEYDIFTLSSCCGHGETGYIIVAGSEIDRMIKLGYEMTVLKYIDNDIILDKDRVVLCGFKPKSKCLCNEKWYDQQLVCSNNYE